MQRKFFKPVYLVLTSMLILAFTVVACNNKKEEKKTDAMDNADTKPVKPIDNKAGTDSTVKTQ